jgi:hypothetical protein
LTPAVALAAHDLSGIRAVGVVVLSGTALAPHGPVFDDDPRETAKHSGIVQKSHLNHPIILQLWNFVKLSCCCLNLCPMEQAVFASCMSLIGVAVHAYYLPFRQQSDNTTAIFNQGLIFSWTWTLVMRNSGSLSLLPDAAIGGALLLVTMGVYSHSVWVVRDELRRHRRSLAETEQADSALAEGDDLEGEGAGASAGHADADNREAGIEMLEPKSALSLAKKEEGTSPDDKAGADDGPMKPGTVSKDTSTGDSLGSWPAVEFGLCGAPPLLQQQPDDPLKKKLDKLEKLTRDLVGKLRSKGISEVGDLDLMKRMLQVHGSNANSEFPSAG